MNEELQRANDELGKRNGEILQLTYAITHDLQTPLATLTGSVEAMRLRMENAPEDLGKWMGRIERSSARMAGMLNDLLLYAKAGTERLELGSVDLAEQIEAAVEEINPQAQQKGVALDVRVEPAVVIGDTRLILRVLLNVVGNAVKYVPQGTGRVEVVSRREGDTARVEVRDNGPGIDPTRLGEVFKPFKRACAATDGTGLGLAIVERCVGALGGRVWLESDGRTGTTAVIVLPAAAAEAAAA
jgi:signal transduction histidine kinase